MPATTRLSGDAPDERSPLLSQRSNGKPKVAAAGASSSVVDPDSNAIANNDEHSNIGYVHDSDEENLGASEEEALLRSDGSKIPPGERVAPDELEDALDPAERRRHTLRWVAFWTVFAVFTTVLVVLAVKKGGAKFDFKDALKKAAGGVSCDAVRKVARADVDALLSGR